MDNIFSILPIILMIFAVVAKLNKGVTRTNQRPRNPVSPSPPWAHNLEASLQKWLSYESPTPTPVIVRKDKRIEDYSMVEDSWLDNTPETEGTAGIEGTDGIEGTGGSEGTAGIEGSAGTEGALKPTISSQVEPLQLEERTCFPVIAEKNLAEAVIWAEILGKPKARINRPFLRNY